MLTVCPGMPWLCEEEEIACAIGEFWRYSPPSSTLESTVVCLHYIRLCKSAFAGCLIGLDGLPARCLWSLGTFG